MGFSSYFKTTVKPAVISGPIDNEKYSRPLVNTEEFQDPIQGKLTPASARHSTSSGDTSTSREGSITSRSGSRAGSRAANDERLVDEIKHQVVLNHLYQHQCSSLWIRDVSLDLEGVMVRKRRGEYLFKPPGLEQSSFAQAMLGLNVQVSTIILLSCLSSILGNHITNLLILLAIKGSNYSLVWSY